MNTQRTAIRSGDIKLQFPVKSRQPWRGLTSILSGLWDRIERGIEQAVKEERKYPAHIDDLRWKRHIQRRELF